MRYLILVKATPRRDASEMPGEALGAAMAEYHRHLAQAGVLLDAGGLLPPSEGWRIRCANGQHRVVDGPFAASPDTVAGYTVIQVRSREEALEWSRRFPWPAGEAVEIEIEVRRLVEPVGFAPGGAVGAARDLAAGG